MKTKIATLLIAAFLPFTAPAHELIFYGVVQQSTIFPIGALVIVDVTFNPVNKLIQRYNIRIGNDFELRGNKGGRVAFDGNPIHGSVYYQIVESEFMEVTAQTATPNGIIPQDITLWNLHDFAFSNSADLGNTSGQLDNLPVLR